MEWYRLSRKGDDHTMPIRQDPLQRHERKDNCSSLVSAGELLYDEEFVEQALHEEAVTQPLDEGRYTYSTTSKCF